jgi:hypothetical protein
MTEALSVPESPTNIVFGFFDDRGRYAVRPLGTYEDDAGVTSPFFKGDEETILQAGGMVEAWRSGLRREAVAALEDVPRADEGALHLDRIDHYYNALGLPSVPAIVVEDASDLPAVGSFSGYARHFRDTPELVAAYFDTPRLVIAANKTTGGTAKYDLEHNIVHEKGHSTGPTTIVLMPQPDGQLKAAVVRNGFKVITPVSSEYTDDLKESNEPSEEAQAEMFAGIYAELFLDRPDTVSVRRGVLGTGELIEIDGKYAQDPSADTTCVSTPLALALELLIERDPQIFEQLIEARLSINGLRGFARGINSQMSGLYEQFLKRRVGWMGSHFLLDSVVNTLYGGDRNVLKKTGAAATSLVVQRLQVYEQRTGYSFGLPASVAQGAVLLESRPVATITKPAGQHDSSAHTPDDITNLLNQVRNTL